MPALYILTDAGRLACSDRALAFGRAQLHGLAGFAASIADAKEKARVELSGGTREGSDTGFDTQLRNAFDQRPHLRLS